MTSVVFNKCLVLSQYYLLECWKAIKTFVQINSCYLNSVKFYYSFDYQTSPAFIKHVKVTNYLLALDILGT